METLTLQKITEAQNTRAKTIEIEDPNFITPWQKLYFSPSRRYAIVNGGYYRWFIVDLFRNLESAVCVETKQQALAWVREYENNQLDKGFENDNDNYVESKRNEDFYYTFGKDAFYNRYYKKYFK